MRREEIGLDKPDTDTDTNNNKRHEWYSKGISYWEGVKASVDGVLGGYGHVNVADVKASDAFLKTLLPTRFGSERRHLVALDCGSGIGRVTKNLLLRHFNEVGLKRNGFFMVKENVARNGFVLHKEDRSVTRADPYFKDLFHQSGLYIYSTKDQKGFPGELFPVKMYVLLTGPKGAYSICLL